MSASTIAVLLRNDWDEIIFRRAALAYRRRFGASADQPSAAASEFDGPFLFVLRNVRGDLARYRVAFTGEGVAQQARLRFARVSTMTDDVLVKGSSR